MSVTSLLVANRGEIAIRVMRAAAELGIKTVAVYSDDDASSLHVRKADEARCLSGHGAAAYLDAEEIVRTAVAAGCDAIHPGYGFLSENAAFARRCSAAGLTFVGPQAEVLDLFGDKGRALALAAELGVPVLPGTSGPTSLDEAREFLASLGEGGAVMVKAIAGGGGRGMRPVTRMEDLEQAFTRCSRRRGPHSGTVMCTRAAQPTGRHSRCGGGRWYGAHHPPVWERRKCTIQRRNQSWWR